MPLGKTPEVLGFVNPVAAWHDKDDDVFKSEKHFFDIIILLWIKSIFQFAFRFLAFPEIGEILKTHIHKKYDLQHDGKIKMLRIMIFWADHQIKMP